MSTNLAFALDSFVGRTRELAQVSKLLGEARLVTLTGAPGIGKTRLAREVASAVGDTYPDGTWMVDLAPIQEGALVAQSVASALGLREMASRDSAESLVSYVRHRHLLIVLDNCEHLLDPCVCLAEAVLRSAPRVSMLVTSRERLGLEGERVFMVGPLALPVRSSPDEDRDVSRSEAGELFLDRARAVQPTFSLTPETVPALVEICRRTEGIPLAIELVAARVGSVSLPEIVTGLDEGLAALTGNGRSPIQRHRSMQAALDWSYQLLSEPERVLLRRLSVFSGGWTVDGAAEICAGDGLAPGDFTERLGLLVAKSLVIVDASGPTTRYSLLEAVRLYAAEHLALAGEAEVLAARRARWCTGIAEHAEVGLTGAGQLGWMERLDAEQGNLRAALSWSLEGGHGEEALRLAGGLVLFWRLRGSWTEGRRWLESALRLGAEAPPGLRGKAMWGAGFLAHMLGDGSDARQHLEQALPLACEAGDATFHARVMLLLGNERQSSDPGEALALLEEAAQLARQADDPWCLGHALGLIGLSKLEMGESATARVVLEECVSVARQANELQSLRLGLAVLGNLCHSVADMDTAKVVLEESLGLGRQLGEPYAVAAALEGLGDVAIWQGDDQATGYLEEALELAHHMGAPGLVAGALASLGEVARRRGDLSTAHERFSEAGAIARQIGFSPAAYLLGLAKVHLARGERSEATRLFNEAGDLARQGGQPHTLAASLFAQAQLARQQGKDRRASSLHTEALQIRQQIGNWAWLANSLAAMAALATDAGRFEPAARLFAASESLMRSNGHEPVIGYEAEVAIIGQALGEERLEVLWAEGGGLTASQAVSYACRRRFPRSRPEKGWSALTPVERDVVALARDRLSNAEIAERLFISPRTVANHLTHVYAKVGVTSRRELRREAAEDPFDR